MVYKYIHTYPITAYEYQSHIYYYTLTPAANER